MKLNFIFALLVAGLLNFLGAPLAHAEECYTEIYVGTTTEIGMVQYQGSAYQWKANLPVDHLQFERTFTESVNRPGGSETIYFVFRGTTPGVSYVTFELRNAVTGEIDKTGDCTVRVK